MLINRKKNKMSKLRGTNIKKEKEKESCKEKKAKHLNYSFTRYIG